MNLTIKSRKLGKTIHFFREGNNCLYVDMGDNWDRQICEGGLFGGWIHTYNGNSVERFETICRSWLKQYIKNYPYECVDY